MSLTAAQTQREQAIYPCQKFEGHTDEVYGVICLPDRQRIMTCSKDGSLRLWNLETGRQIGNDWRDGESEVVSIALSLSGNKLVSGSGDGAMKVWDMDTGKVITKWTGHRSSATCVSWSRDGVRIMSGCLDGTARVWDVESGKTLEINTGFSAICTYGAIYSPDETMTATGGENYKEKEFLKIWDAKTGRLVKNLNGHTETVTCLAWTPDQSRLISGSRDHSIRTWNTTTWQQITILTGHTETVFAIAIYPNGRILASASEDNTARLWNLDNGHPVGSPLQHPDTVNCLSCSTDAKRLVTGCNDNNAYTWDISAIDGIDELLDVDKSIHNDVATQLRNERSENACRIPRFFDDSPHHPQSQSPGSHRPLQSSTRQHHSPGPKFLGHVSSLFQHTRDNAQSTELQLYPMGWVRHNFSRISRRQFGEGNQLQEGYPAVVDVPLTRGKRRNISGAEIRLQREKASNVKEKKTSASSSRPSQTNVTQQSSGAAQNQLTSQLSSSSVTPEVVATSGVTTSTTSRPGVIIADAGCCTRFRLFICCVSTQQTDGHH